MKTPPAEEDSKLTNAALLEELKIQGSEAWDEFFRIYWPFILEKARAAGLNEADAKDVAQQTMVSLWTGLPVFRYEPDKCRFRTWVVSVLRCRVADHFRKAGREPTVSLPDDGTGTAPLQRIAAPDSAAPGAASDAEWEANLLRAARERVARRFSQRELQIYEYWESHGRDRGKTAKELGVSIARVYVAKNRVEREIKKELKRLQQELY